MRYFEVEGDSPNELLEQFLIQQKVSKEFVEVEIIEPGSKGILGIGKKPAKIKIKFDDREFLLRKSKLYLSEILDKAGFAHYHIEVKDRNPDFILNIMTDDSNVLIGKSALTLDSLQYLIDRILKLDEQTDIRILVDVDDYRKRVIEPLKDKALKLAHGVKKSGKPAKLPPMVTIARREVHIVAKSVPGVSTVSHGDGQIKALTIMPDRPSKGGQRPPRGNGGNKPHRGHGNHNRRER